MFDTLGQVGGDVGRSDDAEPAVRRAVHLQCRPASGGRGAAGPDDRDDTGKQLRRLDLSKEAGVIASPGTCAASHPRRKLDAVDVARPAMRKRPHRGSAAEGDRAARQFIGQVSRDDWETECRYSHPNRSASIVCRGAANEITEKHLTGNSNRDPLLDRAVRVRAHQLDLILAGNQPREWQSELRHAVAWSRGEWIDVTHRLAPPIEDLGGHLHLTTAHIERRYSNEQTIAAIERAHRRGSGVRSWPSHSESLEGFGADHFWREKHGTCLLTPQVWHIEITGIRVDASPPRIIVR